MAIKEKIFEQAKDIHVKNYIVFGKSADGKLYYEAAYTNQVSLADAKDAFNKGILAINVSDAIYIPVFFASNKIYTIAAGTASGGVTPGVITEWAVAVPSE